MRWFPLLLLLVAFPALAGEPAFRPQWTATCKFGSTDFSLRFASRSGDAYQDDQVVTLVWGKAKPAPLPVEPALFEPARFVSDAKNYCRDIGAFEWSHGRLLLLIPRNGRPSSDRLIAVVIDAKTGAFVQNGGTLGAIWQDVRLLRHGQGFRVLLERSWHVEANDGGEFPAPDWMLLGEEQGRLVHEWEFDRK